MTTKEESPDRATFRGYASPNYTPVPDELFDEQLPDLSGAELKVLLYIIRRTFGFKKDSDNISLSQMLTGVVTRDGRVLDRGVGLSKKTLLHAIKSLEGQNAIVTERRQSAERGNEPTCYRLNMIETAGVKSTPPLGEKLHQGLEVESSPGPRSRNSPIQETGLQETAKQDRDLSNIRYTSRSKKVKKADSHPTNPAPEEVHNPPPDAPTELIEDRPESHQAGFTQVGALLPQIAVQTGPIEHSEPSQGASGSGPRIEVPAQIRQIVEQATQEFHDAPEKLLANLTRAMNLYKRSGLSEYGFCRVLVEAQGATKRAGSIQKLSTQPGWQGLKNKTPYWFMVVENRLKEVQMEDED